MKGSALTYFSLFQQAVCAVARREKPGSAVCSSSGGGKADRMFGISSGQQVMLVWSQPVDGDDLKSLVEQLKVTDYAFSFDLTCVDLLFLCIGLKAALTLPCHLL